MALPPIPSTRRGGSRPPGPLAARMVDEMVVSRAEWRRQAAAVADAYRLWSDARSDAERARLGSVYVAMLDQEQAAATGYARALADVERSLRHRRR